MGEKLHAMAESIVAFTKRMTEGASKVWKKLNEPIETEAIMSMFERTPSQKHYSMAPISETRKTLQALEAIESSRLQAI